MTEDKYPRTLKKLEFVTARIAYKTLSFFLDCKEQKIYEFYADKKVMSLAWCSFWYQL